MNIIRIGPGGNGGSGGDGKNGGNGGKGANISISVDEKDAALLICFETDVRGGTMGLRGLGGAGGRGGAGGAGGPGKLLELI